MLNRWTDAYDGEPMTASLAFSRVRHDADIPVFFQDNWWPPEELIFALNYYTT